MLGSNFEKPNSSEDNEGYVLRRKRIVKRWQDPDNDEKELHYQFQEKNEKLLDNCPDSNLKKVLEISCKISREVMEHPENLQKSLEDSE